MASKAWLLCISTGSLDRVGLYDIPRRPLIDTRSRRVRKVVGTTTPDSRWVVYNADAQVLVDLGGNGATNVVRAEYGYGGPVSDQVLVVKEGALDGVLLLDPMIGSVRGVAAWTGGTLKKDYRTALSSANPLGTTPADTGVVLRFRWAVREYDQESGIAESLLIR